MTKSLCKRYAGRREEELAASTRCGCVVGLSLVTAGGGKVGCKFSGLGVPGFLLNGMGVCCALLEGGCCCCE